MSDLPKPRGIYTRLLSPSLFRHLFLTLVNSETSKVFFWTVGVVNIVKNDNLPPKHKTTNEDIQSPPIVKICLIRNKFRTRGVSCHGLFQEDIETL